MGSIESRLRRLEERSSAGGGCPECSGTAGFVVYETQTPPQKTCRACWHPLVVFRVVYKDEGEGGA